MPDNNWLLQDIAPVTLAQEFEAALTEAAWVLNDTGPLSLTLEFSAAASEWSDTYWTPAQIAFNGAGAPAFHGNGAAIATAPTGAGAGELVFEGAQAAGIASAPTGTGVGEQVFVGAGAAVASAPTGAGLGTNLSTAGPEWDGGGGGYLTGAKRFQLGGLFRPKVRRQGTGVAVASAPVGRGTGKMHPAPRVRAWHPRRPTIAFLPPQPRIVGQGRAGAASPRGFGNGHQADLLEYLVGAGVLDDLD